VTDVSTAMAMSFERAGLLAELRGLRERSALARETSAALREAALWAGARTLATRDAMWHNRLQWRAWRTGWALWRRQSGDPEAMQAPRICVVCEAVRFTASPEWVTVPATIRDRFRSRDAELGLAPDVCATCVPSFDLDDESAVPECVGGTAWRDEVARLLREVFAEVDAAAAEAAAVPGMAPGEARDRTLAAAVERLGMRMPPAATATFIEAVQQLLQRLRGEPAPSLPVGGSSSGCRGAPGRFRPVLR